MHSRLTLRSVTDTKSVALLPYPAAPTSFCFRHTAVQKGTAIGEGLCECRLQGFTTTSCDEAADWQNACDVTGDFCAARARENFNAGNDLANKGLPRGQRESRRRFQNGKEKQRR